MRKMTERFKMSRKDGGQKDNASFTRLDEETSGLGSTDIKQGEIKFPDKVERTAKYAIVSNEVLPEEIYKNLIKETWELSKPKIVISVTGGAKNFNMKSRLTREFQQGLFKAASGTGAWVISGGTHVGVMKHVGDAMEDHMFSETEKVVVLGIATYGIVEGRDKLKKEATALKKKHQTTRGTTDTEERVVIYTSSLSTSLDKNHSHFILVNDGTEEEFGKEIEPRAKLESYFATKLKVPVVCVLLQGGPGSLKTVYNAIKNKTPVVVIDGSGQWANILATMHAETSNSINESRISELLSENGINGFKSEQVSEWTNMVREIIKAVNLVTVFSIDEYNKASNLDTAILRAILKSDCPSKENSTEGNEGDKVNSHLKLAVAWNRSDIAKSDILPNLNKLKPEVLKDCFVDALESVKDKSAFVEMFLEFESVRKHCSETILDELYEDSKVRENTPLYRLIKSKGYKRSSVLISLMGSLCKKWEPVSKKFGNDISSVEEKVILRELFLWSLVLHKKAYAKVFWNTMSTEKLAAALVANKLLSRAAGKLTQKKWKDEYEEHAQVYRSLSLGILNECYEDDAEATTKVLTQKRKFWGNITCLQLAVDTKDYEFVSHQAVQYHLNHIWLGKIVKHEHGTAWDHIFFWLRLLLCAFLPFLIGLGVMKFEEVPKKIHKGDKEAGIGSKVDSTTGFFSKVRTFYEAPIVKFSLNIFFYLTYLVLFAYVLLFNSSMILEYVLYAWVGVLALDEIRQIVAVNVKEVPRKLKYWFNEFDNKLDSLSFVLFIIGLGLRYFEYYEAKVLWAFSFAIYCTRVLSLFTVHEQLGPKLTMVGKMMKDILFFIFIWAVFLVAYGVASQSLLYPDESRVGNVFVGIFSKPYWQIYGELFLPEIDYNPTTDEFSCTNNASLIDTGYRRCPEQNVIVPILSAVYMLLANVLLLNLLIAMFSYTFDDLANKTGVIWRFQRYGLIKEYYYRTCLVVPFSILSYAYSIVMYCCKKNEEEDDAFAASREDFEKLVSWESRRTEAYLQELKVKERSEIPLRIEAISERLETLTTVTDKVLIKVERQKKYNRRVREQIRKLHESTDSSLQWLISALKDNNTIPKYLSKPVHVKARTPIYPKSDPEIKRLHVEDHLVPWNIPMNDYNPPHYTAPEVLGFKPDKTKGDKPSWADDDLESVSIVIRIQVSYNQFDHQMKVDRKSYEGRYDIVNGLPRNPKGRTGLAGRGLLGRYGPNFAMDPIVTRWIKDKEGDDFTMPNGKRVLEFIAIKRKDTGEWAIPGIIVDSTVDVVKKLQQKFTERDPKKVREKLLEFFQVSGVEVHRGYVDDHRNTDNAWMETNVTNFHDEEGDVLHDVQLNPGKEAKEVKWMEVKGSLELFANHEKFLKLVADKHKANY